MESPAHAPAIAEPPPDNPTPSEGPTGNASQPTAASVCEKNLARIDITIDEILDRTRHAGFGFVAALLALVSIPLVDLTTPIGLAIASLGFQMIVGRSRPWLPRFLRRRRVSLASLESLNAHMTRWTAKFQRVIRPRLTWLTAGLFWIVCGVGLAVQGVSLSLPIPGADWLFVVPIVLYGIGLLEADGLLILICHTITLIQVLLGVILWEIIARSFTDVYRWCAGFVG